MYNKYFEFLTCKQTATLTLQPKLVETARGLNPKPLNNLVKLLAKAILGRSSATTIHVRTHCRDIPLDLSEGIDEERPLVQSSMTP